MKNRFFSIAVVCFLATAVLFNSCKKTEESGLSNPTTNTPKHNYTPPAVTFSASVEGFVLDENGNAVSAAEVKTGSKTTTTNQNGYFRIEAAPFTGDFCYIKAVKKGFFIGSTTIHGQAGNSHATELIMVSQNNIVSFAAAQGKTITLQGGATVKLPANGFVTSSGKAYTGNVNVAVMHLNPEAKNFSSLIPGGDLRAFNAEGQNVQLYSYGMMNVEMRDDAGNLLQLASGQKSTLTIPVPVSMTAPASIPLWYFDEDKGVWIEEGKAALQGTNYVGTVSHFTYWNVDKPCPPAIVKGKVVDSDGNPVGWINIQIGQKKVFSNNDGTFRIYTSSDEDIIVDVIDWETGNPMGINKSVHTPALGQTLDIGTITLPAQSKIKLKANVLDCNDKPFTGFAIIKKGNYKGRTFVKNSVFNYYITPSGDEAEIEIYSNDGSEFNISKVTLPSNASVAEKDLGTIKVCNNVANSDYVKFTYTLPGQQPVTIIKTSPKFPVASYNTTGKSTGISFTDGATEAERTFAFWIGFSGGTVGDYFTTHNQSGIPGGSLGYLDFPETFQIQSDSTIVKITSYGTVGNDIKGTFSGKVRISNSFSDEYYSHPVGEITGEFKIKRGADK